MKETRTIELQKMKEAVAAYIKEKKGLEVNPANVSVSVEPRYPCQFDPGGSVSALASLPGRSFSLNKSEVEEAVCMYLGVPVESVEFHRDPGGGTSLDPGRTWATAVLK